MREKRKYIRGFTEYIILSILNRFDSYGYEIGKIIRDVSDEKVQLTEAALYLALKRMLKNGKINSYEGSSEKGMKRRYYSITGDGVRHLENFRKDWASIENTLSEFAQGTFDYNKPDNR